MPEAAAPPGAGEAQTPLGLVACSPLTSFEGNTF